MTLILNVTLRLPGVALKGHFEIIAPSVKSYGYQERLTN